MSRYWCIDDAEGKAIAEGYSGEWPLKPESVAACVIDYDYRMDIGVTLADRHYCTTTLANNIYAILRRMRPDGGEIPWSEVPEHIKTVTLLEREPHMVAVSF